MKKASKRAADSVAALATMSLAELRTEWQRRYGPPPRHRSMDLLRRVLAWRIQSDIHGGLDAPTRRMLEKEEAEVKIAISTGMRLAREWAGRRQFGSYAPLLWAGCLISLTSAALIFSLGQYPVWGKLPVAQAGT